MIMCGQELTEGMLEQIRQIIDENPTGSRSEVSRRICMRLGWLNRRGKPREVSCRKGLKRLERAGLVQLPEGRKDSPFTNRRPRQESLPQLGLVECSLEDLGPVQMVLVTRKDRQASRTWNALMGTYHYLGEARLCGDQMRYLLKSERYGWLGGLSFSGAALRMKARDRYIGWSDEARARNLERVVSNSRFLILPTVRVKNLASHVLSLSLQRLGDEWETRYGYRPVLVETFVDGERFSGACYKAANWAYVGQTAGRDRQTGKASGQVSEKQIYVYALSENWREVLCAGDEQRLPARRNEPKDWAEQEFGEADLGDDRLTKRLCEIARDLYGKAGKSILEACQVWKKMKGTYRFFSNKRVQMERILEPHRVETIRRMQSEKLVIAAQDTTELNYTAHPLTEGLGPLNTLKDRAIGLFVHDTMAFSGQGTPLGLLDVQCWARDRQDRGISAQRAKRSLEEKESKKWFKSFRVVVKAKRACPGTQVILVSDRESDIHELFLEAVNTENGPDLLIRSDRGRQRKTDENEYLWDKMAQEPVAGIYEILVPAKGDRPGRVATLQVRVAPVGLRAPKRKKHLPSVSVWAVYAVEVEQPAEGERLEWLLLTTIEAKSFEDAVWLLQCYCRRWEIEIFHRTLKSGCKIEDRQLGDVKRIENCLAVDMVVAWRIYYLTMLGREHPDVPCTVFFSEPEWKALVGYVTKNPIPPEHPPSLGEAIRMVARLGGFPNRTSDGQPGPTYMWRGIQKLDIITEVWNVFSSDYHATKSHESNPKKPDKNSHVPRAP